MGEKNYDYGKCHVCGEQMIEREINQDFWVKGNLMVIENVPAGVCPQCGEKVVKADIGQQVAAILTDSKQLQPIRIINVPVIAFNQMA
jgi:YgiT-type zinc finger domain-containing protein